MDEILNYDAAYISATFDEDDGNTFPSNMMVYSKDGEVSVDPEASDSIIYLLKKEKIDHKLYVTDFLLIRDGGKDVLDVKISDYTDKQIHDVLILGDYIILEKGDIGDYILYKFEGNKLKLEEEYYEYDKFKSYPDTGYNEKYINFKEWNYEYECLRASKDLHFKFDK